MCQNSKKWPKYREILSLLHCSSSSAQWKSVKSTAPLPAAGGAPGKREGDGGDEEEEEEKKEEEDVVPIVICSSEERMGATMAAVNSVHSNTDARLFFYIVTLRDALKLTRFLHFPDPPSSRPDGPRCYIWRS